MQLQQAGEHQRNGEPHDGAEEPQVVRLAERDLFHIVSSVRDMSHQNDFINCKYCRKGDKCQERVKTCGIFREIPKKLHR